METSVPSSPSATKSAIDAKIVANLNTLQEKLDLCQSMLQPGDGTPAPSLKNNDALLGVIGFLEACAPRMVELVEAAAQGALSEDVLCHCLDVNDKLVKQLADIDTYSFTENSASTTAAHVPQSSVEDDMEDLLLDDNKVDLFSTESSKGKSTGDDVDDLLGLSAPSVKDETMQAVLSKEPDAAKVEDDLDDFLADRSSS
jgi:hypothetical protein